MNAERREMLKAYVAKLMLEHAGQTALRTWSAKHTVGMDPFGVMPASQSEAMCRAVRLGAVTRGTSRQRAKDRSGSTIHAGLVLPVREGDGTILHALAAFWRNRRGPRR